MVRFDISQHPPLNRAGASHEPQSDPGAARRLKNPQEAAKEFEKVLVQQFVKVMTEQMFTSNLSGEDGPNWMKSYGDQQRDLLAGVLTDHLVENNTFDIASLVLDQWQQRGLAGSSEEETADGYDLQAQH